MPVNNSDKVKMRFNMWLIHEKYKELKDLASRQGRSMSDIIRQLINEFLEKDKEQGNGRR